MPILSNVIGVPVPPQRRKFLFRSSVLPKEARASARSTRRESGRQRNRTLVGTLVGMFFFFSNRMGLAGSILVSLLLSVVLLYACSRV